MLSNLITLYKLYSWKKSRIEKFKFRKDHSLKIRQNRKKQMRSGYHRLKKFKILQIISVKFVRGKLNFVILLLHSNVSIDTAKTAL